jgi:serine protease
MRPREGSEFRVPGSGFMRLVFFGMLAVVGWQVVFGRGDAPLKPLAVESGEVWDVPGEIVVDLRDDATDGDISRLASRYGTAFIGEGREFNPGRILTVATTPALAPALLAKLRSDPMVEAAEPQRLFRLPPGELFTSPVTATGRERTTDESGWTPNDPRYREQWNFQRIKTEQAWKTTRGKGAVVAVIDTGVAFENRGDAKICRDFKNTQFVAPYDFVHRSKHPHDDNGHGTHVAGTIAESTNNDEGVAGIAFEAKIMPIKVLSGTGSGRLGDVAAGIRYAADHGANVINLSLGAPFPDLITRNAIKYARRKGVTIVCAAGNSAREGVGYPAAYPECIAVSALGPTGELAFYSSWGSQVAISAPGGDKKLGEDAGILQNTLLDGQDDYFGFQGTSMATPHVAAVAALVVSQGVKDPAEVKAVLQKSAQARGPKEKFGAGELDAAAAVHRAGAEAGEYYGRLWVLGGLWLAAIVLGGPRAARGRLTPFTRALALTIGLYFPDVIAAFAGWESQWNLLGHSVLLPAFLLLFEADNPTEGRFYGLFAAGLACHLGWDLWQGTAPLLGGLEWAALPWLWANVVMGMWAFLSGLKR